MHRPDLARKEFDRAKNWAEDDTLLQLIEAAIGLVTGKDGYSDCYSFFTEQLANPSLTSPHLLTSRGIARLLRGEVVDARSDLEEAVAQQNGHEDAETLAASAVAAGLVPKKADAEEIWRFVTATQISCIRILIQSFAAVWSLHTHHTPWLRILMTGPCSLTSSHPSSRCLRLLQQHRQVTSDPV